MKEFSLHERVLKGLEIAREGEVVKTLRHPGRLPVGLVDESLLQLFL